MYILKAVFFTSIMACLGLAPSNTSRKLSFNYTLEIPITPNEHRTNLFIPLAQDDEHQTILSRKLYIDGHPAGDRGEIRKDLTYDNEFWHLQLQNSTRKTFKITVKYEINRLLNTSQNLSDARKTFLNPQEKKEFAPFLKANKRVPIDGKIIEQIIKQIKFKSKEPLPVSKAIYDYVVDNMEYKKVGTGWGNGDTFWACSEKFGNCTDFHALFTSLARSQGIPSKFEIGFPIPKRQNGKIGGYHCWVNFNLPNIGWVPIDASEAKKHPENRELFFGTHPTDRIKFTTGRDIVLGKGHRSKPLNYFIFPHAEINGKVLPKLKTKFSYSDI